MKTFQVRISNPSFAPIPTRIVQHAGGLFAGSDRARDCGDKIRVHPLLALPAALGAHERALSVDVERRTTALSVDAVVRPLDR